MLAQQRIVANQAADDWREALGISAGLLLKDGYITDNYLQAICANHEQLGPYMVIAPGICLAHARSEDGALKTGASLLTLNPPVAFGNEMNDPVWFLLCLAAEDSAGHLQALMELTELLMDEAKMAQIRLADTSESIWTIIAQ
jgi:mannitol/fructose-specific phosphotransferase system IIA component (Ntr-type)